MDPAYQLAPGSEHASHRFASYLRRLLPHAQAGTDHSSGSPSPNGKRPGWLGKALLTLGALVLLLVVAAAVLGWNALRGPVSSFLSAKLGRPVAIHGDLDVDLSRRPLIKVDGLTIGNSGWSSRPDMVQIEHAAVRIDALALLHGRVVIPEVQLVKPVVLLERSADGAANWTFGKEKTSSADASGSASLPEIGALDIRNGQFDYQDAALDIEVHSAIDSDAAGQSGSQPTVRFAGHGKLRAQPFQFDGHAATPLALQETGKPYYVDARASSGETTVAFKGTLVPLKVETIDGVLELSGKDLSKLYPIVPVPIPWTPAYRLTGHLVRAGDKWSIEAFSGRMGRSDLSGSASLDRKDKKQVLVADVKSKHLYYKDIAVFLGAPPPAGEAKTADQQQQAARHAATGRILPSEPFKLARLREIDADVKFKAETVIRGTFPLDDVVAHLQIKDGVLKLTPLDFGVAGGHVVSAITLDARIDPMRVTADVTAKNLELKALLPKLKENQGSAGKLGGRAKLQAKGNSIAQMVGAADGEVALIMSGGHVSSLRLMLANLDLANAASLLLKGDENAPLYCAVTSANVRAGWLAPEFLVIDSSESAITGEGGVDFEHERYKLRLVAHSKRPSLVALRGPIVIGGTFKHPEVRPEAAPVVGRAAVAVALGVALTPAAALLALVDPGGAKDRDCAGLIARARQDVAHQGDAQ